MRELFKTVRAAELQQQWGIDLLLLQLMNAAKNPELLQEIGNTDVRKEFEEAVNSASSQEEFQDLFNLLSLSKLASSLLRIAPEMLSLLPHELLMFLAQISVVLLPYETFLQHQLNPEKETPETEEDREWHRLSALILHTDEFNGY